MERTYYTYKITSPDSDKYYYGVSHVKKESAAKEDCLNHSYYGSGGRNNSKNNQNKFVNWKTKYQDNLIKEILEVFENKSEAYLAEKELIKNLWRDDTLCLNSRPGGINTGENNSKIKYSIKTCKIHGEAKYTGDKCCLCLSRKAISLKECEIHGLTKHAGENCYKCRNQKLVKIKVCESHGETKHRGETCVKCSKNTFKPETRKCLEHGMTEHLGSQCRACLQKEMIREKTCKKHGEQKHRGDSCYKCTSEKAVETARKRNSKNET